MSSGHRDLIVVGAGVIGMEYACMINVVPGTTVTVIDPRPTVLSFADNDVIENLQYTMRQNGASRASENGAIVSTTVYTGFS